MTDQPGWIVGADVSRHQAPASCDWHEAAAHGLEFASYKLSEGRKDDNPYIDPAAAEHRVRILNACVVPQPYHFARLDTRFAEGWSGTQAGQAEAEWAALAARRENAVFEHRPMALDLERYRLRDANGNPIQGSEPPKDWCDDYLRGFVTAYEQANGHLPDAYLGPKQFAQYHTPEVAIELRERGVSLWLARPDGPAAVDPSVIIDGWPWAVWQYTHEGTHPGLPTPVDLNRYRGTARELRALVNCG